jgi:V/A-type H+/Na+-transporting ATPase subunit K
MTPTSRSVRSVTLLRGSLLFLLVLVPIAATCLVLAARPGLAATAAEAAAGTIRVESQFAGWALIAAALSTALATLGAGYAVAKVGSAAIGAIAEKPELFGRVLVLVGLAEGIAIYGLIVSILILNRAA